MTDKSKQAERPLTPAQKKVLSELVAYGRPHYLAPIYPPRKALLNRGLIAFHGKPEYSMFVVTPSGREIADGLVSQ